MNTIGKIATGAGIAAAVGAAGYAAARAVSRSREYDLQMEVASNLLRYLHERYGKEGLPGVEIDVSDVFLGRCGGCKRYILGLTLCVANSGNAPVEGVEIDVEVLDSEDREIGYAFRNIDELAAGAEKLLDIEIDLDSAPSRIEIISLDGNHEVCVYGKKTIEVEAEPKKKDADEPEDGTRKAVAY